MARHFGNPHTGEHMALDLERRMQRKLLHRWVGVLGFSLLLAFIGAVLLATSSHAQRVIPKQGGCPAIGYAATGNYCVKLDWSDGNNAMLVMPKIGTCPYGYKGSGKNCVPDVRTER